MATMPNGMTGIFQRTGEVVDSRKARGRKGQRGSISLNGRENIEQVHSPGVMQMLNNPEVREAIPKKATERFNKALDHEIDYLLKG